MAKKDSKKNSAESQTMWFGVEEKDFYADVDVDDVDIAEYNLENMIYYFANTNYFRQIIRLNDGLKPVVRRLLWSMYKAHISNGKKAKSPAIVGEALKIHAHSDSAIYESMIALGQYWKTPVPLIKGKGNFGNSKDDPFAASRYTEATLSDYAYECFFSDYDPDCIETLHNTASDTEEPMSLPTKFPNILVNGGMGLAPCNTFRVPPFNIEDIITNVKKVLKNPKCGDIYMIPDLPTGCPIVDDGKSLDAIAEIGNGTLRMRSDIDIEETTIKHSKCWALCVKNVPWMVSLANVRERLLELKRKGQLPFEELQDKSYQVRQKDGSFAMQIDFRIVFDHAQDPYAMRSKVYRLTDLDKGAAVDLKAVVEELKVKRLSMKELIQAWIDERRSYKRRLYNKKLTRVNERIELLKILIYVLDKDHIHKTIDIIRRSKDEDVIPKLAKHGNMSAFQAKKLSDIPLRQLSNEYRERYLQELPEKEALRKEILEIIRSERRIDAIIADELDDLRKYAQPRKSRIIADTEAGEVISDTMHNLVITNQGYVKKLPFYPDDPKKNANFGAMANGDYPISVLTVHNRDSVMFFDSYGRYSSIPVHKIDNCESSNIGIRNYEFTKLNGKLVQVSPCFKNAEYAKMKRVLKDIYLVSLTSDGYIKKTPLEEYLKVKSTRNIRSIKVREGDSLIYTMIMLGNPNVMIYTKKGKYLYTSMSAFEPTGKDTAGLLSMKLEPDDSCIGISAITETAKFIGVVTEKGLVKKCDVEYFGGLSKRRAAPSYLATLDKTDNVFFACSLDESSNLSIITTQGGHVIKADDIPVMTRKAKGAKLIPVPLGAKIVRTEPTKTK